MELAVYPIKPISAITVAKAQLWENSECHYCGNPILRTTSAKRGSERKELNAG
jgi:hypothetical protein